MALNDVLRCVVHLSVHPSFCLFHAQQPCILWQLYRALIGIGNSALEVEPDGHCVRTAAGSGRNGEEAVDSAASEAFARWLHVAQSSNSSCYLRGVAFRVQPRCMSQTQVEASGTR